MLICLIVIFGRWIEEIILSGFETTSLGIGQLQTLSPLFEAVLTLDFSPLDDSRYSYAVQVLGRRPSDLRTVPYGIIAQPEADSAILSFPRAFFDFLLRLRPGLGLLSQHLGTTMPVPSD